MNKYIFVCTGNTCRSPMAEGLSKKILKNGIEVTSRGLSVSKQTGPNPNAVRAMATYGIDIRSHQSKQFDPNEIDGQTLVLTMTKRHTEAIKSYYPKLGKQVMTLTTYLKLTGDIDDPFGQSQAAYDKCAKQLYELISIMNNKQGE